METYNLTGIRQLAAQMEEHGSSEPLLRELIQQLRLVNEKLTDSERFKGQFLSNIRNEVYNPITSILGLSSTLMNLRSIDADRISRMASHIHNEAFYLDFQFRNIVAAAEIESGEHRLEITPLNLQNLVSATVDAFRPYADSKQVELFANLSDTAPALPFCSDAHRVRLILNNLLANAIEFSSEGSVVVIRQWYEADDLLCFTVQDSGIGIPAEQLERIFDRFVQLHTGTTKRFRGHGLGLSVAQALAEALRGSIRVESRVNEGSSFTVRLGSMDDMAIPVSEATGGDDVLF